MLFAKFWRGQSCRVFSRDILKGGNIGVRAGGRGLGGVLSFGINTANLKGGKTAVKGGGDDPGYGLY